MHTQPSNLWAAPGVHLARIDEDVVILDVEADQYHCLPGGAKDVEIGEDGRLGARDPAIRADLVHAGLASEQPLAKPRSAICRPMRELPPEPAPGRSTILRAGLALAAATIAFRGQSLAQLITHDAAPATADAADEELARLVSAARIARPWIPMEGECLQRAFQLRRLLARHGLAVDWIFGVRTWPFGAHCWLQSRDLVIGDRLARVGRYTPIMRA